MKRVSIPEPVLIEVMNYLANRPYREVVALLAAIQSEAKPDDDTRPEG